MKLYDNDEYRETFRERLKELRKKEGKNCMVLAHLCGLSDGVIWKYEHKDVEPTLKSLIAIADHFHVSTDYLLGRTNY